MKQIKRPNRVYNIVELNTKVLKINYILCQKGIHAMEKKKSRKRLQTVRVEVRNVNSNGVVREMLIGKVNLNTGLWKAEEWYRQWEQPVKRS